MKFELNDDQEMTLESLLKFDNEPSKKKFLLKGSAGTGKTTSLGEYCSRSKRQIILTAPTHKAKHVLQSKAPGFEVTTIHSLLSLVPEFDFSSGHTILKQKKRPKHNGAITTVVIDEASMIDQELLNYINDDIRENKTKYIWSGDHCQLLSVENNFSSAKLSPIFEDYDQASTLTRIVRQAAGNPIIKLATGIRDIINTGNVEDFIVESNDIGSVELISKTDLVELAKSLYKSAEYEHDSNFCKIIAWTNDEVHRYNSFINRLYKIPQTESFMIGSKIVFNEAFSKDKKIIVENNAEGIVIGMTKKVQDGLFYDQLDIEFDSGVTADRTKQYNVICPTSRNDFNRILTGLKATALSTKYWGKYYAFKNMFADIRPNFCSTVNKAQGSEYKNVIIDLKDILKAPQPLVWHLLYTAVTRSNHKVWLIN